MAWAKSSRAWLVLVPYLIAWILWSQVQFSAYFSRSAYSDVPQIFMNDVLEEEGDDETIDIRPPSGPKGNCVSVRLRGITDHLSVEQAIPFAKLHSEFRIGLEFSERPWIGKKAFFSLSKGSFHLFHFLEFLIIGFHQVNVIRRATANTTSIAVPFLYSPMHTRKELCGANGGINCLIADLVLQSSVAAVGNNTANSINTSTAEVAPWITQVFGLESNDNTTQHIHEGYRGITSKRTDGEFIPDPVQVQEERHGQMQSLVDAVLVIDRKYCTMAGQRYKINKIWVPYIDNFPVHEWRKSVVSALSVNPDRASSSKITVGYVDRQTTGRNLPESFHVWLLEYFSKHLQVDFRHLHMEEYTPLEQIRRSVDLDMIIGGHGNGLSHMLWMKPSSYVQEFFWSMPFQFDYATTAQIMRHKYVALMDGVPINATAVLQRDNSLARFPPLPKSNRTEIQIRVDTAKGHVKRFLSRAISDLLHD